MSAVINHCLKLENVSHSRFLLLRGWPLDPQPGPPRERVTNAESRAPPRPPHPEPTFLQVCQVLLQLTRTSCFLARASCPADATHIVRCQIPGPRGHRCPRTILLAYRADRVPHTMEVMPASLLFSSHLPCPPPLYSCHHAFPPSMPHLSTQIHPPSLPTK